MFRISASGPKLLLARGTRQEIDSETGNVEILRFFETAVDLAQFEEPREGRNLDGTERYVSELLNPNLNNPYDVERASRFIAEGHARLATPLYPIAFGMMALAIMLTAPISRRGYTQRLILAIVAAIGLRTIGFILQNAGQSTNAANTAQYVWPLMAIGISIVVLSGKFWRVRRRPPPDLSAVLDDPQKVQAALS